MRPILLSLLMLLSLISSSAQQSSNNQYVNPFVGTDFHGHTFPGATYPFGMVQLSPDTRLTGWDGCSGYHYSDSTIYGFSHTHLSGTGIPDYCDILLMPVSGYNHPDVDKELYKSSFSHAREKASPGYYEVFLDKPEVLVQLTAGKRVGMHRYTFKKGSEKQIVIDLTHRDEVLGSRIEIVDNHTIRGYRRSKSWAQDQIVYFYIEFSEPFKKPGILSNSKTLLTFTDNKENRMTVRTGISSVSEDNAKLNLMAEIKGWEFSNLLTNTEKAWNSYLGKIDVETTNIEDKRIFYTALYHTAMAPNLYSDVNGEYRGMDRKIHKAEGYDQYTVFSLWDTYRALHPLFTIIEQKRTTDFIKSFLAIYKQAGKLPIWELAGNETNCMIGYHSIPVIADAMKKSIGGFDATQALNAMVSSSNRNEYGIDIYIKNGFIPAEMEHESVSKTLEYAYDDWCIAQVAKQLENMDLYKKYLQRAQYYKNVFDPSTGFMRPKIKGSWLTPFNPTEVNFHFVEANSWQYSFYVPQDIATHIKMLGGDDAYSAKLDELFSAPAKTTGRTQSDITGLIGQYAHGNEPSHHTAYLYNYAGKPWKTQEIVRKIMGTLYSTAPDGLCGNDDCGQMSAWYVISAIGFYPVTPGDNIYALGSPLFSKVIVNIENGKKFTIKSPSSDNKNIYIKSALLNGKDYKKSYITHNDIITGSTIDLRMAPVPDYSFGTSQSDRPRSSIDEYPIVTNPWFEMDGNIFKDSIKVGIKTGSSDNSVWYRTEESGKPGFQKYSQPLTVKTSSTINAYSENDKGERSPVITAVLNKIDSERKIRILTKYNPQYTAGGDEGLLDGVRGEPNFRLGGWQGYQDTDFEAIVDLGSIKNITRLGAGFLQDARSWIWIPQYVEFAVSSDGLNFVTACIVDNDLDPKELEIKIRNLVKDGLSVKARYVKVYAKNLGVIPDWHESAGEKAHIFIDEIIIDTDPENKWQFRKAGENKWIKATVPGTVHTDLLAAGLIGDPYYRLNEKDLQWIDKNDWEYRTTLFIDKDSFSKNNIILRFEGLDTYADVWLNGKRILQADNMFRTWEADIKKIALSGENELVVLLKSPVNIGLEKLEKLGYPLPASNDQSENGGLGNKQVSIFVRKAGYHFGWDWGPRLVTSGIWRPVKIVAWDNIRITDLFVKQKSIQESRADFLAEAEVQSTTSGEYLCTVTVNGKRAASVKKILKNGYNKVQMAFSIKNPELWWPNGLGNQRLYDISVQVGQNTTQSDIVSRKIGVRTIKHIRKADNEGDGESFMFEVNGRPVFAKGANIIPNDIFLPSVTPEKYEFIVKSAAQANMNMLRVWGGGVYENDIFYDLCDKYGIMIWQDFMFACSMYPGDDAFLENVRLEAVDNVKRLRNHASLAIWCGNNEIETAWAEWDEKSGWGWKQQYDPERRKTVWHSYDTLFHKILPAVVSEYTDGQPYWHSSPSKGYRQLSGSSGNKGDVHYWGVWHAKHPIEAFREYKARFMSEYGFQSFPEFSSVKKYTLPEDWDIESKVMASHQRSGIGNLRIREYMEKSYRIPSDFELFLYTGQVLQAEAIKMAIESHRTDMPFCMGSLYWQLNDCWPVASWSGIDSYLKWKALHYFAREAFKNTVLTTVRDSNFVTVNAVSDEVKGLDAVLTVNLMDFRGKNLFEKSFNVKVPSNGSAILTKLPLEELLKGKSKNEILLLSSLKHKGEEIDTDILYFTEPKDLILPKGEINFKAEEKEGCYYVTLSSPVLCKNIMIISDNSDVNFSDNFFDLLPGKEVVVSCKAQGSLEEFRRGLRVIKTESR